jgi:hypothetical protein
VYCPPTMCTALRRCEISMNVSCSQEIVFHFINNWLGWFDSFPHKETEIWNYLPCFSTLWQALPSLQQMVASSVAGRVIISIALTSVVIFTELVEREKTVSFLALFYLVRKSFVFKLTISLFQQIAEMKRAKKIQQMVQVAVHSKCPSVHSTTAPMSPLKMSWKTSS